MLQFERKPVNFSGSWRNILIEYGVDGTFCATKHMGVINNEQ